MSNIVVLRRHCSSPSAEVSFDAAHRRTISVEHMQENAFMSLHIQSFRIIKYRKGNDSISAATKNYHFENRLSSLLGRKFPVSAVECKRELTLYSIDFLGQKKNLDPWSSLMS